MNSPDVLYFECQACHLQLSVPMTLAGVTGPCPSCAAMITAPTVQEVVRAAALQLQKENQAAAAPIPAPSQPVRISVPIAAAASTIRPPAAAPTPAPPPQTSVAVDDGRYEAVASPPEYPATAEKAVSSTAAVRTSLPQRRPLPGGDAAVNELSHAGLRVAPFSAPSHPQALKPWGDNAAEPPRKTGIFLISLILVLLAMAGVASIFWDQLSVAWHTYRVKYEDALEAKAPLLPSSPANSPTPAPSQVETAPAAVLPMPTSKEAAPLSPAGETPPVLPTPPTPPTLPPQPGVSESPESEEMIPKATAVIEPDMPAGSVSGSSPDSPTPGSADPVVEVARDTDRTERPARQVPALFTNPPEDLRAAAIALRNFLEAPNWKERSKHVQWSAEIQPVMEQYYRSNPDGPIRINDVGVIARWEPDAVPGVHRHHVFEISGGDIPASLPVMVEENEKGWQVDWLTFIEGKDQLLERFCAEYVDQPARFRVLARRKKYFQEDVPGLVVPGLESKISYEIQPPAPGFVTFAFAEMNTPLATDLDRLLGWDVLSATVVMELQWRREGDKKWVEIVGLPYTSWRTPKPALKNANAP